VRIVPFGEAALLVELEQRIAPEIAARASAIADAWEASGGGTAIPAYASVVLRYDPLAIAPDEAERRARAAVEGAAPAAATSAGREVVIPTIYDGPDLASVAERSKVSVDEVIAIHSGGTYRAYFLGFMPGWAYLGPLDPRIVAPRRAAPRARVPARSVAVIDGQTGVYPFASPGGWQLIGRTELELFDATATPPARIAAGDTVRFVPR
jgi:KipI family sensor histidine kinase inhibitor